METPANTSTPRHHRQLVVVFLSRGILSKRGNPTLRPPIPHFPRG